MEAVCRGAQQAGGFTLGILPGSSTEAGNAFLSLALPTGLGEARNALVSQAGEVVIAIGGGYGTLSEIALALKAGRKVIAFKTWTVESTDGEPAYLHRVETPEEAVEMAMKFVKGS
jgi:hypothetical protein